MKFRRTIIATTISLAFYSPAYAAIENTKQQDGDPLVQKITQRTQALEKEVHDLRQQLKKLTSLRSQQPSRQSKKTISQETSNTLNEKSFNNELSVLGAQSELLSLGATPVISSPYLGVRSAFDGSDLITRIASYNQDILLLRHRQKLENAYHQAGIDYLRHPLIELSGQLEGQVTAFKNYDGTHSSDIDLTSAELDFTAFLHDWVTAYMAIVYESSGGTLLSVSRAANSRIKLSKGFITVGNLDKCPWYATLGQRVLPFGQYSSNMLSDSLPKLLFKIKDRSILAGYQPKNEEGLYGSAFVFKGDTNVGNSNINNVGADLGFKYKTEQFKTDVGVDYIANIADSEGMQQTGGSVFGGFGSSSSTEVLAHRVPGFNLHGKLGLGDYYFLAEYTGAAQSFDPTNATFNGVGAKPAAYHVEGAYHFNTFTKQSDISVGYDRTYQSLAFNLPEKRYIATYNVVIWRNTIASLEYQHNINYGSNATATGAASGLIIPSGHTNDQLTAQFGIYF